MPNNIFIEIHSLIIMIFSFSIMSITIAFDKKNNLLRAQGSLFFIPFIMTFLWKTLYTSLSFYSILYIIDFSFLIVMSLLHLFGKNDGFSKFVVFLSLCAPIVNISLLPTDSKQFLIPFLPLIILFLILLNMILLRINFKENKTFFFALTSFAIGMELYEFSIIQGDLSYLIFRTISYIGFSLYFFKDLRQQLFGEIDDALKLKADVERDINKVARKRVAEIEFANKVLLDRSNTDPLTGALNKRALIAKIKRFAMESNKDRPFSILMLDIDKFKDINDNLGHAIGDQCIVTLSKIALSSIRNVDILGRYGGDEFIILLPNAHIDQAQFIAERFRKNIEAETNPKFTVSIGIACAPMDGKTYEELLNTADEGLYFSKEKGRNAVSYKNSF